ncbi:MAG: hypothetical protein HOO67_05830 [Candidatus Peribacteraceae bacterium]|nr:hypothetical protein [Candidatus Peribacteraceae bacterium]
MSIADKYPDSPKIPEGILPHWLEVDGEDCKIVRSSTIPAFQENQYELTPARMEAFVRPVTESIGWLLYAVSRNVWKNAKGEATYQIPGKLGVEVKKKDAPPVSTGIVVTRKDGEFLAVTEVQTLFPGLKVLTLEEGKKYYVPGLSEEAMQERSYRAKVLGANSRFLYTLDNTVLSLHDEQSVQNLLENDLKIHDIWRDVSLTTGNTASEQFRVVTTRSALNMSGRQSMGATVRDFVYMGGDITDDDFKLMGKMDTLKLPILDYLFEHSEYDRLNQRHTIGHEMGHASAPRAPDSFQEGMAEIVPTFLSQHVEGYKDLPELFGGGDYQVLFGDPDDLGTTVNYVPDKEFDGFHSVRGWIQARALWKAVKQDGKNLRKLFEISKQKEQFVEGPMQQDAWLRAADSAIPGFTARLKAANIFAQQKPGKKVYWCSRADGWGALSAYEMDENLEESKTVDFAYRLKFREQTIVVPVKGNIYVCITPDGVCEDILQQNSDPNEIRSYIDTPVIIEAQSPMDGKEWKPVRDEPFRLTEKDFAKAQKNMDMKKEGDKNLLQFLDTLKRERDERKGEK